MTTRPLSARLAETAKRFWYLGFIAFGGPGVHVVLLRRRFVDELKWVDATTFADLFTLGNALPGPGSTQLAFSLAIARNGSLAGLVAFLFWSLPAAAGMSALGAGVRSFPDTLPPIVYGLLTGLNAAAVGLIALAAYQLSATAVTDGITRLIVLGSASFGICYHAPWMYPVMIAVGGSLTLAWDYRKDTLGLLTAGRCRRESPGPQESGIAAQQGDIELAPIGGGTLQADAEIDPISSNASLRKRAVVETPVEEAPEALQMEQTQIMTPSMPLAISMGVLLVVGIITLLVTRSKLANPPRTLDFFCNMLLAGVIIFGGGAVVIPLLVSYTVENGWVRPRDFLLGFAVLQAFPGPNFAFASFLGVLAVPTNPALGAFLGYLGIFSPGVGIKLALLPLYNKWRRHRFARSVLRGLNAAAAGLVYTAVWSLFLVGYIYKSAGASGSGPLTSDPFWGVVAASAFVLCQSFKLPPAFGVLGGAVAGLAWFGVVGVEGVQRVGR